jgi:hypothetical protein
MKSTATLLALALLLAIALASWPNVSLAYVPTESEQAALKDSKTQPELLAFCNRFASCWISLSPSSEEWIVVRACDEANPIGDELLLFYTPDGTFDHVSHGL